jgi:NAD(P)-dependent dehydrogenase (short-subunit alcohol dehydrogenase family)
METNRGVETQKSLAPADLFDLSGKVAIVTGSGRGLGKAMAMGLAAAGATVVTCSRTLEQAEQTADEIAKAGGEAAATRVDTSDRKSCEDLVGFGIERFGRLDVLVNNAGIDIIKPVEEYGEDEWDQVVDINLKGYFLCAQLAGRRMLDQGTGGSIINNSSIASTVGVHGLVAYSAAKGGVNQLTRVMAVEWAQRGVRVNAVAPGIVETPLTAQIKDSPDWYDSYAAKSILGRWAMPYEMVGMVIYLASEASSYVTGAFMLVDGGWTAADGRFEPPL